MKRKNLFLSLISSVIVAVAIVTVTICSVVQPKKNNNNNAPVVDNININTGVDNKPDDEEVVDPTVQYDLENTFNRNGSKEYPYIIYSTENFKSMLTTLGGKQRVVTAPVTEEITDENGETKTVNKLDENGRLIFEAVLDEKGNKTYGVNHFELVNDIDFAGEEFVTLFNQGEAFIGNINGNGFSLKNISINVTPENFEAVSYTHNGNRYLQVALFGETNGSTFENLKIDTLKVNVSSDVHDYISAAKYKSENPYAEMVVAGFAGYAIDTKLQNVEMNAEVAGSSYYVNDVDADGNYIAENAMGGLVAIAENLTIDSSKLNIKVSANAGSDYLLGGVAGYGRTAKIAKSEINVNMETTYSRKLSIAGLFAYGRTLDIADTSVNFALTETASEETRNAYVTSLTANGKAQASDMVAVAGLVSVLRANDDTQKTTISNVKVTSNIDFDCIYAGAILDTYSTSDKTVNENKSLITLSDILVDTNANVLALHGFARQLVATTVTYSEDARVDGYYNIKLAGDVKLTVYEASINATTKVERGAVTIFTAVEKSFINYAYKDLFIKVSNSVDRALMTGFDRWSIMANSFGDYDVA